MSYQNSDMVLAILALMLLALWGIRRLVLKMRKTPEVEIGNAQTIGDRKEQEDSFATVAHENGIFAVLADGMGGYFQGKMASSLVVNTFVREFGKSSRMQQPAEVFFRNTAFLSNKRLLEKTKGAKSGTTLVAVIIAGGYLNWASIGDSAIALFRDGEFINLNKKQIFQTVLEEKYLSGEITQEELMNHPKKKRLTNYIGYEGFKDIEISQQSIKLRDGDRVLLCSDGVYNSVTEMEMEKILSRNIPPYQASETIISLIREKRITHQDNATIIILEKNNSD